MRTRTWMWALSGLCGLVLCVASAAAQEKKPAHEPPKGEPGKVLEAAKQEVTKAAKDEAAQAQEKMAEMMKKWMEYATPGDAHKRLEFMLGKWDCEVKWWMEGMPEPMVSTSTCEIKWMFDGRFLQQDVSGPAEGPEGKPFKGLGFFGYDNAKKQYNMIWFDNMGTGIMMGYGKYDEASKTLNYAGEYADPMSGNQNKKWRSVFKVESDDKFTYETFTSGADGKEYREALITYTKTK